MDIIYTAYRIQLCLSNRYSMSDLQILEDIKSCNLLTNVTL